MRIQVAGTASVVAVGALIIAACSGSTGMHLESPSPTSTGRSTSSDASPTSPPTPTMSSPTVDPRVRAATSAYVAFDAAVHFAEKRPSDQSRFKAIKAHAVDPALAREGADLFRYQRGGVAFKGTPPPPRVSVKAIHLDARPYPAVALVDCPSLSSTWNLYTVKGHKLVPTTVPKGAAKPPYALTVAVIFYKSRWMVHGTRLNVRKTCAPSS